MILTRNLNMIAFFVAFLFFDGNRARHLLIESEPYGNLSLGIHKTEHATCGEEIAGWFSIKKLTGGWGR